MSIENIKPGDIVVTNFEAYQHWSIVSDYISENKKPMLISATKRNGTVKEEDWDTVTQGHKSYIAEISYEKTSKEVLEHARSQIGKWKYSVMGHNCEHFVKWATGLEISSTQVIAATSGALLGFNLVGFCSKNPNLVKFLGGSVVVGSLALLAVKATEKK